MTDRNLEQRINIKFCVKIGKSARETLALLQQAYGEHSMKKSSVFEWYRRFKQGWEDAHIDTRSGQPKTQRMDANMDTVRTLIRSHQKLSVQLMAGELNMNRETVQEILTKDWGMRKISVKMVPRILTDQKERHLQTSSNLLKNTEVFDFFFTVHSGN
ncbi:unnamed protein product [Staurois parvus]|uniref:Mos1 transposase HTH domain-containing protein n=1 Tax=Staurois parvus TaxID=386267 RepID=A0ABN9GGK4_9NEOB|nr:unnamed protein product [Staurois parvus]